MTYIPTTDKELQRQHENGELCWACSTPFTQAHGHRAACPQCYRALVKGRMDKQGTVLASYDTEEARLGKIASRKRRTQP